MPKVLVIDDSVSVRKVVERALAGRQVEVVCAASGGEALEQLERDAPDVIVCDVVMPDRDGYEICYFVKNHPRLGATPVILMSGIVNDEVRQRAARARSEGVLAKPFAAEDLLKRLDDVLGPLPPREAAPPVSTPTLMPVSPLTVEPYVAPRPDTVAPPKPPRSIAPLEPVAEPEPLVAPVDPGVPPPAPSFEPSAPPARLTVPEPVMPRAPEPVASRLLDPLAALEALAAPTLQPPPAAAPEPVRDAESAPASESSLPAAIPSEERARGATDGAAAILAQFATMDGVQWAVLADREGFVVESSAKAGVDADVAAALSACLAESSDGLGRELDRGGLHGIILEYERGMVVVYGVGTSGLLAVGLGESAVLGKVRYFARKSLAELARAV